MLIDMYRQCGIARRAVARRVACFLCALLGALAASSTADDKAIPQYLGPCDVAVSPDGKTAYVALADGGQVAWVGQPGGKVIRRVDVPAEPSGLALTADGARLIVTCAAPRSRVVLLDTKTGQSTASFAAGHTAVSPVVSPDGSRLYVCNRFSNDVSVIDLASGKTLARVPAVREPVAAAITPDGKTLLVANHLPNRRTDAYFMGSVAPEVTRIDTDTLETSPIELPVGSNGLRDMAISPDGRHGYVTHLLGNFQQLPTQVERGWINVNTISVIDVPRGKLLNTIALDEMYEGAANPWGVTCTSDGRHVVVAHAGTHELSVIDADVLLQSLPQMFASPLVGAIFDDPPPEDGPVRRIELPGNGPRALALAGSKVFVTEYFSDTLAVVDLASDGEPTVSSVALGPKPQLTPRRRGELLFNDATICYLQWQSCASCHPDGRTDGLNWDLMNDGTGNPKNTKSMVLAHRTPPSMAEGVRATAEEAVRSGLQHILFAVRPEDEAAAIDAYLKSLPVVASPHLIEGQLSPAARRGKALFESPRVACHRCHPAPLYTDGKIRDVGTRRPHGFTDRFDTPTLVEVWRTAPYLHDGRHMTIKDLIVEGEHGISRRRLDELSDQEIDDLCEFVLSL